MEVWLYSTRMIKTLRSISQRVFARMHKRLKHHSFESNKISIWKWIQSFLIEFDDKITSKANEKLTKQWNGSFKKLSMTKMPVLFCTNSNAHYNSDVKRKMMPLINNARARQMNVFFSDFILHCRFLFSWATYARSVYFLIFALNINVNQLDKKLLLNILQ